MLNWVNVLVLSSVLDKESLIHIAFKPSKKDRPDWIHEDSRELLNLLGQKKIVKCGNFNSVNNKINNENMKPPKMEC